jgi:hypothetical protein
MEFLHQVRLTREPVHVLDQHHRCAAQLAHMQLIRGYPGQEESAARRLKLHLTPDFKY